MGARIEEGRIERNHDRGRGPAQAGPLPDHPDRIEVGTYLIAAAMTGGDVTMTGCRPDHVGALLVRLKQIGARVEADDATIRVVVPSGSIPSSCAPTSIPAFPPTCRPR
jgi:UDP-N-acetylglucosamine 1-carboxyvinyltransferase